MKIEIQTAEFRDAGKDARYETFVVLVGYTACRLSLFITVWIDYDWVDGGGHGTLGEE